MVLLTSVYCSSVLAECVKVMVKWLPSTKTSPDMITYVTEIFWYKPSCCLSYSIPYRDCMRIFNSFESPLSFVIEIEQFLSYADRPVQFLWYWNEVIDYRSSELFYSSAMKQMQIISISLHCEFVSLKIFIGFFEVILPRLVTEHVFLSLVGHLCLFAKKLSLEDGNHNADFT